MGRQRQYYQQYYQPNAEFWPTLARGKYLNITFLDMLLQIATVAAITGFLHWYHQWVCAQHFLAPPRKIECWFYTSLVACAFCVVALVTVDNAIEVLIRAMLATTGLAVGTFIWCSWFWQENLK